MAYDYHTVLPSLAPASVTMFLTETVRSLGDPEQAWTLLEWLRALTSSPHAESFRQEIRGTQFAEGRRPLVSLIDSKPLDSESIAEHTVFSPSLTLTAPSFSQIVFLELQAIKAITSISPMLSELDNGPDEETDDDEGEI